MSECDHGATGNACCECENEADRMARPKRIQLRRAAGFRLQDESLALNGLPARSVARPGPFGNPFVVTDDRGPAACVFAFRTWLTVEGCDAGMPEAKAEILRRLPEIRGHNLGCWCQINCTCHADVLLDLANREKL